jgi:hypothetical protein
MTSVIACTLSLSCKEKTEAKKRPLSSKSPLATAQVPLSEEDRESATSFAQKFEDAAREGDEEFLKSIYDFERIIDDSFADIDLPDDFDRGLKKGMATGRDTAIQNMFEAKVDFIEVRNFKGKPGLLFRYRIHDGIDYIEYQISKNSTKNPEWVISDAYTYSMGSYTSDLLRSMILPAVAQHDRSLVEKILKGDKKNEEWESLPKVSEMMQLARTGEAEAAKKALGIWETIPEKARQGKFAMIVHITAQSCLFEDIESAGPYLEAINDFEKAFPGDPAFALLSIDQNIMRGDFEGARNAIKTLREAIPDPYLDFYQGYVDLHEEKFDSSETLARNYIALEPSDQEGYELLLEAGFGAENHEVTAEALTKLESDFGMDYSAVLTAEDFGSFNRSEAGKAWAESIDR